MSTRPTCRRPPILLVILLALTACKQSPEEQQQQLQKTETSWQATTELTRELHSAGALTDVYARQTQEAARQELDKARRQAKSQ
jgi:hypothetical protein